MLKVDQLVYSSTSKEEIVKAISQFEKFQKYCNDKDVEVRLCIENQMKEIHQKAEEGKAAEGNQSAAPEEEKKEEAPAAAAAP